VSRDGAAGALVLLVEDDEATRAALRRDLMARGYRVDVANDGAGALRCWQTRRPAVVVLDLGLPDMDGTQVIRHLRSESQTPLVVISARGAEDTKVAALEMGADDYVTKPFGVAELHARLRALLRRSAGEPSDVGGRVIVGPLVLDTLNRHVTVAGQAVELTPREYEVLRVFLAHRGRLVTRGRLLRAVWGEAYSGEDHYVHVYVSQLRRKLARDDADGLLANLIVTEPGVGYRIRAD
jgi:two-component system KDP operon response regulator KdpE